MDNDTCVIITGLIEKEYVISLLLTYKDIRYKVISTWKDQDQDLLKILENNGFIIVLNDYPEYKCSTNYQTRAIYAGIKKAQECQFKYIVRMRTDVECLDFYKLLCLIRHLYIEKFTCICGQSHYVGWEKGDIQYVKWSRDFFQDFLMAGPIDDIIKMFSKEQEEGDDRYTELYWIETYLNRTNVTPFQLKMSFNYFLPIMLAEKIDFYWIKVKEDLLSFLSRNFFIGC